MLVEVPIMKGKKSSKWKSKCWFGTTSWGSAKQKEKLQELLNLEEEGIAEIAQGQEETLKKSSRRDPLQDLNLRPHLQSLQDKLKTMSKSDLERIVFQKLCEVVMQRGCVGKLKEKAQMLHEEQERFKNTIRSMNGQIMFLESKLEKYISKGERDRQEKAANRERANFSTSPNKISTGVQTDLSLLAFGIDNKLAFVFNQRGPVANSNLPLPLPPDAQRILEPVHTPTLLSSIKQEIDIPEVKEELTDPISTSDQPTATLTYPMCDVAAPLEHQDETADGPITFYRNPRIVFDGNEFRATIPVYIQGKNPEHSVTNDAVTVDVLNDIPQEDIKPSPLSFDPSLTDNAETACGIKSLKFPMGVNPGSLLVTEPLPNMSTGEVEKTSETSTASEGMSDNLKCKSRSSRKNRRLRSNSKVANSKVQVSPTEEGFTDFKFAKKRQNCDDVELPLASIYGNETILSDGSTISSSPRRKGKKARRKGKGNFANSELKIGTVPLSLSAPTSTDGKFRHPAPLPAPPPYLLPSPGWGRIPPAPILRITETLAGLVLSWDMITEPEDEKISHFQIFAYKEVDAPPDLRLWMKVTDLRALPLPMACTLTHLKSGQKFHFAVRAVDIHSRIGYFSSSISVLRRIDPPHAPDGGIPETEDQKE